MKHHKRANAEVQWQPCRCAGPSVKAAGLSLHLQRRAISAMGVNILFSMLTVEIGFKGNISTVIFMIKE